MLAIQSVRCARCGSKIDVLPSTLRIQCRFCGSRYDVTRDASGQPVAVPVSTKATSYPPRDTEEKRAS